MKTFKFILVFCLGVVGGVFISKNVMREPSPVSPGQMTLKCSYCAEKFFTEPARAAHVNSIHLKFACDKCPERFLSEEELTAHKTTHRSAPTPAPRPRPGIQRNY